MKAVVLIAAVSFALGPRLAHGAGALAVGMSGDIAKDGYAIGLVTNYKTDEEARQQALRWCETHGSKTQRKHCKIVEVFHNQCAAEASDPKTGTPGAGWAIGPDEATAQHRAMDMCRASAGKSRQKFCKLANTLCDKQ